MLYKKLYNLLPLRHTLKRPVFIIGCGRSGTTILGKLLSQHSQIAYLHEPRHIWCYEPRTDIWSEKAQLHGGKLNLTANELTEYAATQIYRQFAVEVGSQRAQRLVEKLPINSFRISFINKIFPDSLFVHIIRNGIEVAQSIAKRADLTPWFGYENYKWHLLSKYACERGEGELVALCTDNLLKGMLEWRLSVSIAIEGLASLPAGRSMNVRYEDLIQDPVRVCDSLESFIGLKSSGEMRQFAATKIYRRSSSVSTVSLSPVMCQIGADLLTQLNYVL